MSTCEDVRMSLGAHMLGALDADEAVLVEAHLAICPECRAEFTELSGLTALLGRVCEKDIEQAATPPKAVLDRLIATSARRRRRLNRLLLGLAASLGVIVVGGSAWLAIGHSPDPHVTAGSAPVADTRNAAPPHQDSGSAEALAARPSPSSLAAKESPSSPPAARTLTGRNGRVRAELTLTPGGAGTSVEIVLSGVASGTACRAVAIRADGAESPVGNWTVGHAYDRRESAAFTGRTGLATDRIHRLDIRTATGRLLVSIPSR